MNNVIDAQAAKLRHREAWKTIGDNRWQPSPLGLIAVALNYYVCINGLVLSPAHLLQLVELLLVTYGVLQFLAYYIAGAITCDRTDLSIPQIIDIYQAIIAAFWTLTLAVSLKFNASLLIAFALINQQHNIVLLNTLIWLISILAIYRVVLTLRPAQTSAIATTVFYNGFNEYAVKALEEAQTAAHASRRSEISPLFILVGILADYNGVASRFVRARGISQQQLHEKLDEDTPPSADPGDVDALPTFSTRSRRIIEGALKRGKRGDRDATSDDLFFEALKLTEVQKMLQAFKIDIAELKLIRK